MQDRKGRRSCRLTVCILLCLILFNIFYFTVSLNEGVLHIFDHLFNGPRDATLENKNYQASVEEFAYLNTLRKEKQTIVFLGDSITAGYKLREYFSDSIILNRGINSDTTTGLLNRIDNTVNNLNIEKLFIMIGYNDLQCRSNSSITKNVSEIVSKIKSRQIYLQSILPIEARKKKENFRITQLNDEFEQICATGKCKYIDLHSLFMDKHGGGADPSYFRDGVHPNVAGYTLWTTTIKPYVK
jgi:lysophospholipase L1-like esterase